MTSLALTAEELLAWHETTSSRWQELLTNHPEALAFHCDIAQTRSVGELLQHIVAVELRYAERLSSLPITDYATIPFDSVEALYAIHTRASSLLKEVLASGNTDWAERIEFTTRSKGAARSSKKAIFFHTLLHSARHYAQLATIVRQHGIHPGWPMDYLFMDMEKV